MAKHEFHFAAISKITCEHHDGAPQSSILTSDLRLECSGNLDRSSYIDGKGLPRKDAMKPLDNALIQGLITNIRNSAVRGWWKEGEHLRYVIDELQRAFVAPGETGVSTMEY